MSRDILLLMTQICSEEELIDQLESALKEYRVFKSNEKKKYLRLMCLLVAGKETVDKKGADAVGKEMEQVDRIKERMNSANS